MSTSETIENYLESIHILSLRKGEVRAIDICRYLEFSRPTVSITLKKLEKENYVTVEKNKIKLTEEGLKIATKMYERHETVAKLLISLGVSEKQAYIDSCLIEHDLSTESFTALKKIYKKIVKK
ncbi:MAG: metal-dependent transcriptional regulator [Erysipelotrichaceae bacterium]|nr:metal-dependent transcriptional regulator [Erysipelotrichaceae bacterium]